MNETAFYHGYLEKTAVTWGDIYGGFQKATINPAVRAALFGGGAYLATRYGGGYLLDKAMQKRLAGLPPRDQKILWENYQQRKKKMLPWLAGGAAALGAAMPLTQTIGPYASAIKKFRSPEGKLSDLVAPLMHNKLPSGFPEVPHTWKGVWGGK